MAKTHFAKTPTDPTPLCGMRLWGYTSSVVKTEVTCENCKEILFEQDTEVETLYRMVGGEG